MKRLVGIAVAVLLGGVLSWTALDVLWILSGITCAAGIGWLWAIGRDRALRTRLGKKLVPCVLATVLGLLLAAVPLLGLLGLTIALLARHADESLQQAGGSLQQAGAFATASRGVWGTL